MLIKLIVYGKVKKGKKIEGAPMAGGGGAPIAGNEKDTGDEEEKKD